MALISKKKRARVRDAVKSGGKTGKVFRRKGEGQDKPKRIKKIAEKRPFSECDQKASMALMKAVEDENVKGVRKALGEKANVDVTESHAATALMIAAKKGNREICEILLAHGADIEKTDALGLDTLYYSGDCRDREFIRFLIEQGVDINYTTKLGSGISILMHAVMNNNEILVEELLFAGATVTKENVEWLEKAAKGMVEKHLQK